MKKYQITLIVVAFTIIFATNVSFGLDNSKLTKYVENDLSLLGDEIDLVAYNLFMDNEITNKEKESNIEYLNYLNSQINSALSSIKSNVNKYSNKAQEEIATDIIMILDEYKYSIRQLINYLEAETKDGKYSYMKKYFDYYSHSNSKLNSLKKSLNI